MVNFVKNNVLCMVEFADSKVDNVLLKATNYINPINNPTKEINL